MNDHSLEQIADRQTARCRHYEALLAVRRDLHDEIGSTLAGMAMQVELARLLVGTNAAKALTVLSEMSADLSELMDQVRRLGLGGETDHRVTNVEMALRPMLRRMNQMVAPRLEISLQVSPEVSSVSSEVASAAFSIVREAVVNVLKHSAARHCTVSLYARHGGLRVRVQDDGSSAPQSRPGGSGVGNMTKRATEQGGWCTAGPLEPCGFVVVAYLPSAT